MKRAFLFVFLIIFALGAVFAQRVPAIAIMPLEATGGRVTTDEASRITEQVVSELKSWGSLNVLQAEAGAEYVVRGTLSRVGNNFVLEADTLDARSNKKLNGSKEQAASLAELSIFSFCSNVVQSVPLPNYLLGTWQSTINMPDGPVVCIIEFKSDRTARVERYDTWEHKKNNSLRYEGYGTGNYSYAGYFVRRTMTVNSQQILIDAMTNFNLTLEETLPEQTSVSQSRLGIQFNAGRNAFEIIGGSLPCGRNYDGAAVYPSAYIGFTSFTKIR
jgi:TolB-like protein